MSNLALSARSGQQSIIADTHLVQAVDSVVRTYYPILVPALRCCLAVFGSMSLARRTKPLSIIFETTSGYGKSAVCQMVFPLAVPELDKFVYRTDKFTPKAFVSHAANMSAKRLAEIDLLPKLRDRVLVTKELAPIFRGRVEELTDNFSVLISVLDGMGFTSDSGMRGHRGYHERIVFNWVGATTPLPPNTHRVMHQLGTRLLFYEVPSVEPTEEELFAYAGRDDSGQAEVECNRAVNGFLWEFLKRHPVGSVAQESIVIPTDLLADLVKWATFVVTGRTEVRYERDCGEWEPIAALKPEGPWKVVNFLKELARGNALIEERDKVDESDLAMIGHVAISSIPGHLRPIVRELRKAGGVVDSPTCAEVCKVSRPTARKYLKELSLLGIAELAKGSPQSNEADEISLAGSFQWLRRTYLES